MIAQTRLGASYRDPSGFIFRRDRRLLRQVNHVYRADYEALMCSGLYEALIGDNALIPHEEVDEPLEHPEIGWKILHPQPVRFISYPYEWSFSQLKHAALATLELQKRALERGMSLKDASAFNIQFHRGRPVLIDTLSFERYEEGQPWVAYRQFCQHFLAPLALTALRNVHLHELLLSNLDGIPVELASKLLPSSTWLRLSLLIHVHLHAKMHKRHGNGKPASHRPVSRNRLLGIIDNLESTVAGLKWQPGQTQWADYYNDTNYSESAMESKRKLVAEFIQAAAPKNVWDLGANNGHFSRLASDAGIPTIAFDVDPGAVEINYLQTVKTHEQNLLPLVMNLANPSPSAGWHGRERMSLLERGPADLVLALALVHHLAISHNVPLGHIAQFMAQVGHRLLIEFVPKTDSQVGRLLVVRKDIFSEYTQEHFETQFSRYFVILAQKPIAGTHRMLYLMTRKD